MRSRSRLDGGRQPWDGRAVVRSVRGPHIGGSLIGVLAGLALGAVGIAAFADPPKKPATTPAPAPTSSASASPAPPASGHAPDPAGQASRKQWLFDVAVRHGKAEVARADAVVLDHAVTTARVLGRFAIELYIGKELLDRVRFNAPLTGDDRDPVAEGKARQRRPFAHPTFDDVSTRMRVQIADNPRATYAQLVDRATGEMARFWWPPEADGRLVPWGARKPDRSKPGASDSGTARPR